MHISRPDIPPYDKIIYVNAHCESRILHSPKSCKYCDEYPEAQYIREMYKVAYTDKEPTSDQYPCPAIAARGPQNVNSWGGNVSKK